MQSVILISAMTMMAQNRKLPIHRLLTVLPKMPRDTLETLANIPAQQPAKAARSYQGSQLDRLRGTNADRCG